jgi:hypothetical protein
VRCSGCQGSTVGRPRNGALPASTPLLNTIFGPGKGDDLPQSALSGCRNRTVVVKPQVTSMCLHAGGLPDGCEGLVAGARARRRRCHGHGGRTLDDVIKSKDRGGPKDLDAVPAAAQSPAGRAGHYETRWPCGAHRRASMRLPAASPGRHGDPGHVSASTESAPGRGGGRFLPTNDQILQPELIH